MASEVFREIADRIREVNKSIIEAKDLLKAMREVGMDTTSQDMEIRNLEKQKAKWEKMLTSRGYTIA